MCRPGLHRSEACQHGAPNGRLAMLGRRQRSKQVCTSHAAAVGLLGRHAEQHRLSTSRQARCVQGQREQTHAYTLHSWGGLPLAQPLLVLCSSLMATCRAVRS